MIRIAVLICVWLLGACADDRRSALTAQQVQQLLVERQLAPNVPQGGAPEACKRYQQAQPKDAVDVSTPASAIDYSLCWIERHTDFKSLRSPRVFHRLPREEIRQLASRFDRQNNNTSARYSCATEVIYFPSEADLRDITHLSILVHELVHHAQCVSRKILSASRCEAEREAYRLQGQFVRDAVETLVSSGRSRMTEDRQSRVLAFAARMEAVAADPTCKTLELPQ